MSLPVHFVGFIPRHSPSDVFATVPKSLVPGSLQRIPDGEPGERGNFTFWQFHLFTDQGLGPALFRFDENRKPVWRSDWGSADIDTVLSKVPQMLETGYDTAAIESYSIFRQAKAEGDLAEDIKFHVGIPTPTNFLSHGVQPAFHRLVEPRYAAGLERAIRNIKTRSRTTS